MDDFGRTAFTLSESNSFLKGSNNINCILVVHRGQIEEWVNGAALTFSHGIVFLKTHEKMYALGFKSFRHTLAPS